MSHSINIDDILNANDSDEDNEVGAIDLEQLLDDVDSDDESDTDDDDESNNNSSSSEKRTLLDIDTIALESDEEVEAQPSPAVSDMNKGISDLLAALGSTSTATSPPVTSPPALSPVASEAELKEEITKFEDELRSRYALPDVTTATSTLTYALDKVRQDEQKQLLGGNRDLISPLSSKIAATASHDVHLKSSKLNLISSQLSRNAQFSQHGPGTVTVVKVTTKYIIFGTSRGLILLFDHTEKIKIVLGSTTPTSTATPAVKNIAITALDVNHSMDIIYCGYENGEIAVWDIAKNTVLKRINDLHYHRILRLHVVYNVDEDFFATSAPDFCLVSVDVKGTVNKIKISKVLWSYTVTFDCLLDGSAGPIIECVPLYSLAQQLPSLKVHYLLK